MPPTPPQPWLWTRFLARFFDLALWALILLLSGLDALLWRLADWLGQQLPWPPADLWFDVGFLFLWLWIETLLLVTWGYTPGKWLLQMRLLTAAGQPLSWSQAMWRSFTLFWRGLGIGIPLFTLIAMTTAASDLRRTGVTAWDQQGGFAFAHQPVRWWRYIIPVLLLVGGFAMRVWGVL